MAKQLQVPLDLRTVPLLYYYCTTTVILLFTVLLLYCYCTTTVLLYDYCTTVLLLYYYCTTTVLLRYYYCTTTVLHTTVPYQASDVVDCGGECRSEATVLKMTGFSLGSYLGVTVAWLRLLVVPKPRKTVPGTPKPSYWTTTALLLYDYRTTVLLLYSTTAVLLLYSYGNYCTAVLQLHYYCTVPGLRRGRLWRGV